MRPGQAQCATIVRQPSRMDVPQIFLSYNGEDRPAAMPARDLLRARGVADVSARTRSTCGVSPRPASPSAAPMS
jgi:hypothetical protein